ncbi:hypothetical protein PE36_04036 [Moritella sp. PE36]|nr:hypothetical protein PE36_04036 [Moritella sp. PE36]
MENCHFAKNTSKLLIKKDNKIDQKATYPKCKSTAMMPSQMKP